MGIDVKRIRIGEHKSWLCQTHLQDKQSFYYGRCLDQCIHLHNLQHQNQRHTITLCYMFVLDAIDTLTCIQNMLRSVTKSRNIACFYLKDRTVKYRHTLHAELVCSECITSLFLQKVVNLFERLKKYIYKIIIRHDRNQV